MKVKNQKCIRRLSYKSLWASRKRNVIAIFAIALTTLLFTSLYASETDRQIVSCENLKDAKEQSTFKSVTESARDITTRTVFFLFLPRLANAI